MKWQKITALFLSLLLLFSFTACDSLSDALDIASDILDILDTDGTETEADSVILDTEADPPSGTSSTDPPSKETEADPPATESSPLLDENGIYDSKENVALYLHLYGHLPANFITKSEARKLGWEGGSVEVYAKGCAIGGDTFGNFEGLLPKKSGRTYKECDIDTLGKSSRGAKRIVFSNDGLIYYTDDHYETFTLLYGEP